MKKFIEQPTEKSLPLDASVVPREYERERERERSELGRNVT